jgi:hypothetical protein
MSMVITRTNPDRHWAGHRCSICRAVFTGEQSWDEAKACAEADVEERAGRVEYERTPDGHATGQRNGTIDYLAYCVHPGCPWEERQATEGAAGMARVRHNSETREGT